MKPGRLLILTALSILTLASCETTKWVAPEFTSVNHILNVKSGMTMEDVNTALGISPYDVYTIREDGGSILVYNYVKQMRALNESPTRMMETRHSKEGLTRGEVWYDVGNPSRLYVYFLDGRMMSLITDVGRTDAKGLILTNNKINLIAREEMPCHPCGGEVITQTAEDGSTSSVIPLRDKQDTPQHMESEKKEGSGLKAFLGGLLVGSLAIALIMGLTG